VAKKNDWHKGEFTPKNPEKYVGTYPIVYRSSWENAFMQKCDMHPSIQKWASESIKIPYYNPFIGKNTLYVPDFLIQYVDRSGRVRVDLIEIKPRNQTNESYAKGRMNKAALALNKVKWAAATQWAKKHGMRFRVMTESDMFM
jgi:hypothetical protein